MPARKRERIEPTEDWSQLQLRLDWPEQIHYELIRPVVVFGQAPAERAKLTGRSTSTIYRQTARFDQLGMASLFEAEERPESKRQLPPNIRRAIVQLKAEYPAFGPNELATICYVRFNRRPSSHTIQKLLAEEPPKPKGGRSLLQGRGPALDTLESEGQMIQRVMPDLMGLKNILVLDDEAHHCYREKPDRDEEGDLVGDDRREAEKNNEVARLWISGLEAVNRKLGITRVVDLSPARLRLRRRHPVPLDDERLLLDGRHRRVTGAARNAARVGPAGA